MEIFCRSKRFLLAVSFTLVYLSYFLYTPVYDGIDEPWKVRSISMKFKIIHYIAQLSEIVGWESSRSTSKKLVQYMLNDNKPPNMEGVKHEDYRFDAVPVRLYRPVSAEIPSPCVIFLHGGGWTISSVDAYDDVLAEFAGQTGYVFVAVDYRLAPENPFPVPFDDCYKASLYLLRNAKDFGCDERRIATAGDSAGGNLAAAVTLKLSETEDVPKLRFQWLIYPALQALDFQLPSYISNDKAVPYFMRIVDMITFYCNYIGITPTPEVISAFQTNRHVSEKVKQSAFGKYVNYKRLPFKYHGVVSKLTQTGPSNEEFSKYIQDIIVNPFFAPLMKSNLSRVPPAFIFNAEYDVLRDDGLLYALRLKEDGVEVEEYTAPHAVHSFMFFNCLFPRFEHFDVGIEIFAEYAQNHFQ